MSAPNPLAPSGLYGRRCSVSINGGALELSTLRCRFQIHMATVGLRTPLYLRVTNLSPQTVAPFLAKEHQPITISAGYQNGQYGVIFSGDITQSVSGRENPTDTLLSVVAHDGGEAHIAAAVNKTFPAGSTPNDLMNAALAAMAPYGVTKGYVGPDMSQPQYPRAQTFFGMAWELMEHVAATMKSTWSIQQGKAQFIKTNGDNLPGAPFVLNTNTGLIGMPTQEIGQVLARCLINPSIRPGSLVQIAQGLIQPLVIQQDLPNGPQNQGYVIPVGLQAIAADGIYLVFAIDVSGDTRGLEWYYDLHLRLPGATNTTEISKKFPQPS
jgi:hypothetical protein